MRLLVATVVAFVLVPVVSAQAAITPGWTSVPDMSVQRAAHAAVALDATRVLVTGGSGLGGGAPTASAEIFDTRSGTWTAAAPMLWPRGQFDLVRLASGQVLAAGGVGTNAAATAELYDPATNRWSAVGPMHVGRASGPRLFALSDGRALVVGGDGAGTSELLDPTSRSWSNPVALYPDSAGFSAVALSGSRVLITGGSDPNNGDALATAATFDAASGWSAFPSMLTPRTTHQLTLLGDGRVLATGGEDRNGPLVETELYDPRTNGWTARASMPGIQYGHTATALPDGTVLAVGGRPAFGAAPVATAQRYFPATNTWAAEGAVGGAHFFHTATALPDGRVLVTGGFSQASNRSNASADLWTPTTTLAADPVAFGDVAVGAASDGVVKLTNTGALPLIVEDIAVDGGDFRADRDRCEVAPGATCALGVRFTATAAGARSATLTFTANTTTGRHAVALSARAVAPAADADGDGIPDATDRCASVKGAAGRSGCPTGLLADPSIAYRRVKGGIRVVAYYVKATTGARVSVKCTKGCKSTVTKGRGSRRVRITRLTNRRLTNGTKITVTVSMPGRLTTRVTDRVTRGRRVEGRPVCTPVGC